MTLPAESIELSQLSQTPTALSSQVPSKAASVISTASHSPFNSQEAASDRQEGLNGTSIGGTEQAALPPVDRGWPAWQFVIAATVLEYVRRTVLGEKGRE